MDTGTHHVCPIEHAGIFDRWYRYHLQNPERILNDLVHPGMTVLDIGCGPGYFSIPMARMVGEAGRMIAADVQQGMLDLTARKAQEAGVAKRISLHLTEHEHTGVTARLDFALAFYMVHEVPDKEDFLREIYELLRPGGKMLIAEPAALFLFRHMYKDALKAAEKIGFTVAGHRRRFMARCAILAKPGIGA